MLLLVIQESRTIPMTFDKSYNEEHTTDSDFEDFITDSTPTTSRPDFTTRAENTLPTTFSPVKKIAAPSFDSPSKHKLISDEKSQNQTKNVKKQNQLMPIQPSFPSPLPIDKPKYPPNKCTYSQYSTTSEPQSLTPPFNRPTYPPKYEKQPHSSSSGQSNSQLFDKPTEGPSFKSLSASNRILKKCQKNNFIQVYIANPNDCTSYYQCFWGVLYFKKCEDNLHFNERLRVCDWPKNARCVYSSNKQE